MRTTVLKPLGLITKPNEFGQYPAGALKEALNVHMRDPGKISSLPLPTVYKSDALATGQIARRIWSGDSSLLVASDNASTTYAWRWVTGSGANAISFPEYSANLPFSAGKTQVVKHRGRFYLTTDSGVYTIAAEGTTNGYLAGFPPPRVIEQDTATSTAAQAIEDDKTAAWKAIFVRKGTNNSYEKIGPPSNTLQLNNNVINATVDVNIKIGWSTSVNNNLQAGDIVELYRTPTQDVGIDPGADFFLTRSQVLTSTDIANKYVIILDSTPDAGLGAELYTNEDQEGSTAAKYPPPYATDAVIFKGHTFYIAPKIAAKYDVRVPGTWGRLISTADRTHGIGAREVTATSTSGNAVLTSVSNTTGVVAGQYVDDLSGGIVVPVGTTVVSKTSNTITMSANALSSVIGGFQLNDVIEIDGFKYPAIHPYTLSNVIGIAIDSIPLYDQNIKKQLTATATVILSDLVNMVGVEMILRMPWFRYGVGTVRATNGQNFSPPLPEIASTVQNYEQDERYNRLLISELDQPEAVAATGGSELLVGNGILYRIFATTDALWVLASDGLWRVSGEYPDWRVDPIDDKLLLCSRNSADMLKGKIWAKTNRSLVRISDAGIEEISTDIVDDLITKEVYSDTWNTSVVCDEENSEVNVITINSTSESVAIVYNAHQERFTSTNFVRSGDTYSTAHAYVPYLREMVWGAVQASAADIIRSSSATNTRMGGESVKFQPITGDGDPNTLKEFIDCTYLFTTNSSGFAILPSFNGTAFPSDLVVSIPYTSTKPDGKGLAGIPTELSSEEVSVSNSIAPGFSISTVGSNPAWTLKSISLRWKLASEETF